MTLELAIATARDWVADNHRTIAGLSDLIWDFAEPGLCENRSAAALMDFLARHGFAVERGVSGMPTAFIGRFGDGRPRIGVMCEYDAIPGENQRPSPFPDLDPDRFSGFTDLHNGIGVASAAAAVGVAQATKKHGIPGTIVVHGTPAEKLCIGKPFMARDGHFDELDAMIAWHPRAYTTVEWDDGPTCYQAEIFDFHGRSAYGGAPWHGVSALDGVLLMNVIVQFLREHLTRSELISINEMVTRGGDHPTSLPNHAQVWYVHRALTRAGIERSAGVLDRAARAACEALDARFERRIVAATRAWLPNHTLAEHCFRALQLVGAPRFDGKAHEFAAEVLRNLKMKLDGPLLDEELTDPRAGATREFAGGADDVTEYCWHAPTARIYVAFGLATPEIPNWARSAFTRMSVAHSTVAKAAEAMAASAVGLIGDPETLRRATEEFQSRVAAAGNLGPLIPPGVKPPVDLGSAPPYVRDHMFRAMQTGSAM